MYVSKNDAKELAIDMAKGTGIGLLKGALVSVGINTVLYGICLLILGKGKTKE